MLEIYLAWKPIAVWPYILRWKIGQGNFCHVMSNKEELIKVAVGLSVSENV